jgi:hypothetical protein
MEALHWQPSMFTGDFVAYGPDSPFQCYYTGPNPNGLVAAIAPDETIIGEYATTEQAMEACEAWYAEKGWY